MPIGMFLDAECSQKITYKTTEFFNNKINVGLFSEMPLAQNRSVYIKSLDHKVLDGYFCACIESEIDGWYSAMRDSDQEFLEKALTYEYQGRKGFSTLCWFNQNSQTIQCKNPTHFDVEETILLGRSTPTPFKILEKTNNTFTLTNESYWRSLATYRPATCFAHKLISIGQINKNPIEVKIKLDIPADFTLSNGTFSYGFYVFCED